MYDSTPAWLSQALRSGVINGDDSYRFEVPSSYREVGVANIQSGNFCMVLLVQATHVVEQLLAAVARKHVCDRCALDLQPNCGEPWTEVIFADDKEGKIQVEWCPATAAFDLLRCQCLRLHCMLHGPLNTPYAGSMGE